MITPADQKNLSDRKSFDSFLIGRFSGDIEDFVDNLDAGLNHLLRTDLIQAKKYVLAASRYSDFLPPQWEARIISLEARYCLWTGDYREALKIYTQALRLFQRFRKYEPAARLRKGLVEVHMYLGQYEEAVKTGKTAINYFRRKDMSADLAQCMTNVGNVYHRMDRNYLALQYYDKAREVFARQGGIPLAIVDYNRANIYTNLGNLRKAKSLYLASADIYSKAGMEIAKQQAKYAVAYLLFLETRYSESLIEFESVYDAFARLGDERAAALTMLDMAEINIQLNQYGSAIMLAESSAEQFKRFSMAYEEGKSHYFVAIAKLELGDLDHASQRLEKAEKLFLKEENTLWIAMVKHARVSLMQARNRHRSASQISAEAEKLFDRSGDIRRKTDSQLSRLRSLGVLGRTRAFAGLAGRLKTIKLTDYQHYSLQTTLGDSHFKHGRHQKALTHYKSAIAVVEKMLSRLFPDEVRFLFASDKYRVYLRTMECYLKLDQVDEAFLLNLRGLSSVNRPPITREELSGRVPSDVLAEIDKLRAALHRIERTPKTETRSSSDTPAYVSEENRLWRYEKKARMHLYRDRMKGIQEPYLLKSADISVPGDTTLINYVTTGELVGAFIQDTECVQFVALDVSPEDLQATVRKLTFVMERSITGCTVSDNVKEMADHYLERLYSLVFAPLTASIRGDKLVILSDGDLNQIPFPALLDRNLGYLKDRFRVHHAVRPEDLSLKDTALHSLKGARNALFGVPSDTIPFVETECRAIRSSFPRSRMFIGGNATRQRLMEELTRADGFVHIAAHASRSCENPLFSRILLDDGPFFPFDLFGTGVRSRLVTISGCQTAAPGLYYGNSFSLAKAFYQAGARYVLASLWTVSDEVTTLFMTEFYKRLRESADIVMSYRHAVNSIEKRTQNPAYWSPFVLLGT